MRSFGLLMFIIWGTIMAIIKILAVPVFIVLLVAQLCGVGMNWVIVFIPLMALGVEIVFEITLHIMGD